MSDLVNIGPLVQDTTPVQCCATCFYSGGFTEDQISTIFCLVNLETLELIHPIGSSLDVISKKCEHWESKYTTEKQFVPMLVIILDGNTAELVDYKEYQKGAQKGFIE